MPGCGEEDEYLGRGGSLEDGDLYLCWNNCPGLAVVTCHHFTSIHRKLSQLEGIQFRPGKVDICRCQRVILQSESGPRTDHGGRRLTCRPSASLLRHGNCKLRTGVRGNPCHSTLPRAPQSHGPPRPGGDTEQRWLGSGMWCVPGGRAAPAEGSAGPWRVLLSQGEGKM